MEFLIIIPIVGVFLIVALLLSAVPLFFALRMVGINEGFFKALMVNIVAGVISFAGGIGLNLIGFFLAGITNALSVFLPFIVLTVVLQQAYRMDILKAALVAFIQYIVVVAFTAALIFAVLIPTGIGAAFLNTL